VWLACAITSCLLVLPVKCPRGLVHTPDAACKGPHFLRPSLLGGALLLAPSSVLRDRTSRMGLRLQHIAGHESVL